MTKTTTEKSEPEERGRRVYRAPVIEESGSFERLVLMCGRTPTDTDEPACEDLGATS